jgi:hypothetical protein
MLVYLEGSSEKIGDPNKTVEIYESKFGQKNTIGDTLLRASGCLVVLNANPVEQFLFPFWTESSTH